MRKYAVMVMAVLLLAGMAASQFHPLEVVELYWGRTTTVYDDTTSLTIGLSDSTETVVYVSNRWMAGKTNSAGYYNLTFSVEDTSYWKIWAQPARRTATDPDDGYVTLSALQLLDSNGDADSLTLFADSVKDASSEFSLVFDAQNMRASGENGSGPADGYAIYLWRAVVETNSDTTGSGKFQITLRMLGQ